MAGATAPTGAPGAAPAGHATTRTERRAPSPATRLAPTTAPAEQGTQSATPSTVPIQAPPGTDPDLWSVLSQDERAYFARLGAMGPLSYGRVLSGQVQPQQALSRGARLDVKG